jgi:hypothetical protein
MSTTIGPDETRRMARRAGILYLLFALIAIVSEFLLPRFVVVGDPAATLRAIAARDAVYRAGILLTFTTLVFHLLVVASLYRLLARVDAWQATLMTLLVGVGVALALANMLHRLVPLVLLSGADSLSALARAQLEALAYAALRLQSASSALVMLFWGLWLFPLGTLVYKSGFLPRWMGVLLFAAGLGYVAAASTSIALPAWRQALSPFVTPLYVGEVPIIFGLLRVGTMSHSALLSRLPV